MFKRVITAAALCLASSAYAADNGLITVKSQHDVSTTTENLRDLLSAKGMTLFNVVDHAAGAAKVGQSLAPTQLVIFGNPKIGTKLMNCSRSVAIDLPMKALIWSDDKQQTWISYNDPQYLAQRHGLAGCEPVLEKVSKALANFSQKAAN